MKHDFVVFDEWSELDYESWRKWWSSKAGQAFRARFDSAVERECLACLRRLRNDKELDK